MAKKATITKIGTFDAEGLPVEWEFEQNVRLVKKPDGTYTIGGHTNTELLEISEKEKDRIAQESAAPGDEAGSDAEATDSAQAVAEPAGSGSTAEPAPEAPKDETAQKAKDLIFTFSATIVGVAAKKPPKLRVHKEIKILSPDLEQLQRIDSFLEHDVEVSITIRRRNSSFASGNMGKNVDNDGEGGEKPEQGDLFEKDVDGESPEPDVQLNPDDVHDAPVAVEGTGDDQEPVAIKPVCSECGGDLEVNPDDPAQLICVKCGCVHVNTSSEPAEFE